MVQAALLCFQPACKPGVQGFYVAGLPLTVSTGLTEQAATGCMRKNAPAQSGPLELLLLTTRCCGPAAHLGLPCGVAGPGMLQFLADQARQLVCSPIIVNIPDAVPSEVMCLAGHCCGESVHFSGGS